MRKILSLFIVLYSLTSISPAHAQVPITDFFYKVEMYIDTNVYVFPKKDSIVINKVPHLYFEYQKETSFALFKITPNHRFDLESIKIIESTDYRLTDTILWKEDHFEFKLRFSELTLTDFLKINFLLKRNVDSAHVIQQLHLLPCNRTVLQFTPINDELFIGEEKVFELITNNVDNIQYNAIWMSSGNIDYRISKQFGQLRLHLIPNKTGSQPFYLNIKTIKPSVTNKRLSYDLPPIQFTFNVKNSRLQFLNLDNKEFTLEDENRLKGIEVQMDNHRFIEIGKTYRIENQEEAGGALIAELYVVNNLANNKALCLLRPYNYHRKSDGYLYIKDCESARFITNFNITPKTSIKKIEILRPGKDWSENLSVLPGETIEVKMEGDGLHKAKFMFEDVIDLSKDSLIRNENICLYKLRIPVSVSKKSLDILNHGEKTGYSIKINEYQEPRNFDFVAVNYGQGRVISNIREPILYDKLIKDITFSFLPDKIDAENKFYGKQYFSINIRITDKANRLIEMRTIDNIVICPGDNSPRAPYYMNKDCNSAELSLNNYISRKTTDLDEWSRIEIEIKHDKTKYNGFGSSKKVEIFLQRHVNFDIEVSFPTGLLIKKSGEEGYGNFGGISMAIIAQLSFYHPEKIARYRPYRIGSGFLALNAFNFDDQTDSRDVGAVIIGSLYPTTKDTKLSFPLYLGGGYFLDSEKWFYLVGPGIRVKL